MLGDPQLFVFIRQLKFTPQRTTADAKDFGGTGSVAAQGVHDLLDVDFLHFSEGHEGLVIK